MSKTTITPESLMTFADSITEIDPRIDRCKLHMAESIVFLSLAAVICGAQTWNAIEDFGIAKEDFFKAHLPRWHGVPSHDTISRFFAAVETVKFENLFRSWIRSVVQQCEGTIAFDGKTICGASESEEDKKNRQTGHTDLISHSRLHMISAYSTECGLSLGQLKVDEKSNEITAIPELIDAVFLPGCVFTADALNCQKAIAEKVLEKGGNYVLIVKGNQGNLHNWLRQLMQECISHPRLRRDDHFVTRDEGHGRVEVRTCYSMGDMAYMRHFPEEWAGMKTVGCVVCERFDDYNHTPGKEVRYFISSLENDAENLLRHIREHWQIENNLHWHLDVNFMEDMDRKKNNAAQNFSLLCKIALAVLKNDDMKRPINRKRLFAGWKDEYLWKLLNSKL